MGGVGVKRGGCGKNKMRTNRWMSMGNVKTEPRSDCELALQHQMVRADI